MSAFEMLEMVNGCVESSLQQTLSGLHCWQPVHRRSSPSHPPLFALALLTATRNVSVGQRPLAFLFGTAIGVFGFVIVI